MKVLIAGDFCDRHRVSESIKRKEYNKLFNNIKPTVESADYSIVNFEFPIINGRESPIRKYGPCLKGQPESVDAIKYAGFRCATLANNHILDQDVPNGMGTKFLLEQAGIDTVGFGNNINEASSILYKNIQGRLLAVINCCEHEFSIATEMTAGANPLNPVRQYYSILEARKKADYVLVIVHGGHEHYHLPSPRMQETYRFFIDAGADVVVNHHQHCYSGYEVYHCKPIFYGLGNLCFDIDPIRINDKWNYGYMVEISFEQSVSFRIIPYSQCEGEPVVRLLDSNAFERSLELVNDIISDAVKLKTATNEYYTSSEKLIESCLEPVQNQWVRAAQYRNLFPSLISKKWLLLLLNIINCEAHRDRLLYYLVNQLNIQRKIK